MIKSLFPATALIFGALIKPVLSECRPISYTYCEPDRIVHYFDPDTGEICPNMDCGGGRAPPKTDKPGCPFYMGTELPKTEKSYLPCWTPSTSSVTHFPVTTMTGDINTEISTILGPLPTSVLPGLVQSAGESSSTSIVHSSHSTKISSNSTPETTKPSAVSGPPPAQGTQSSTRTTTTVTNSGSALGFPAHLLGLGLINGFILALF